MAKVIEIANDGNPIRTGTSQKNNKPYSIFEVVVDSGESVQVFGPVKVGDEITGIMFDEKYNVTKGQVARAGGSGGQMGQQRHEEIMNAVRKLYGKVQNIELLLYKMGAEPLSGEEKARATADAIKSKVAADAPAAPATAHNVTEPAPPPPPPVVPDTVIEDIGDEPINLDDIPF